MSKTWLRMHKKDYYYKRAKEEHYRSRAAFKLKEINGKYGVMRRGDLVLDLGAAPGGWSQVAKETVGSKGGVIAIDLQSIKPIDEVILIRGDMTHMPTLDEMQERVQRKFGREAVDVVLSDMAPNLSGNYGMDHARSIHLAESALRVAETLLKRGGNLVIKVFQGDLFINFENELKKQFQFYKPFSPKASRSSSSEIYLIAKGYKRKA